MPLDSINPMTAMANEPLRLARAPIVEAVLDIECDLAPGFDLAKIEGKAREAFKDRYPKERKQFVQEHKIETRPGAAPAMSVRNATQALQFLQSDEQQLVQVRAPGFSFNRLAPYTSLDAYLPEIERAWGVYRSITAPVQIRAIRLRYINRILLPSSSGKVDLDRYLKVGPRLPDEEHLTFVGFLNQHAAVEHVTGHQANIVLTSQAPEAGQVPIIFDNSVLAMGPADPADWSWIAGKIAALRDLKNRIFRNTLSDQCLSLFQQ